MLQHRRFGVSDNPGRCLSGNSFEGDAMVGLDGFCQLFVRIAEVHFLAARVTEFNMAYVRGDQASPLLFATEIQGCNFLK